MVANQNIDWSALASQLNRITYTDSGWSERSGTDAAREALEVILGSELICSAVDCCVSMQPGFGLARSVLGLLRPPSAMDRCREIYLTSDDVLDRRAAVELLGVVAVAQALEWVPAFLADPDLDIQGWGIGVVDQLLMSNVVDFEDCLTFLDAAEAHSNEDVKEKAREIREQFGPER